MTRDPKSENGSPAARRVTVGLVTVAPHPQVTSKEAAPVTMI